MSNNSPKVIEDYLVAASLSSYITAISGRENGTTVMKPHPEPLMMAASALDVRLGRCVMVGDAVTDIQAANHAGVQSIGYARGPSDSLALMAAGANAIIDTMAMLASAAEDCCQAVRNS